MRPSAGLGRPTVMQRYRLVISRFRILSFRMRRASAVLAAMTMPPVFRSIRLQRAGVKAFSQRGFHSRFW